MSMQEKPIIVKWPLLKTGASSMRYFEVSLEPLNCQYIKNRKIGSRKYVIEKILRAL